LAQNPLEIPARGRTRIAGFPLTGIDSGEPPKKALRDIPHGRWKFTLKRAVSQLVVSLKVRHVRMKVAFAIGLA